MADDLKYEGILALIQTNNENTMKLIEANHKSSLGFMKGLKGEITELKEETKIGINKLEQYNLKQNGRQADMMKKIAEIESDAVERRLTCGRAVEQLTKDAEELAQEKKRKQGQRLTRRQWVALFIISVIMSITAIGGFIIGILNLKM